MLEGVLSTFWYRSGIQEYSIQYRLNDELLNQYNVFSKVSYKSTHYLHFISYFKIKFKTVL